MKELTAQEAKELGKNKLSRKTKKFIMKEIKRVALSNCSHATMCKSDYLCWEQIVEWLSDLGYKCELDGDTIIIRWG
jgi:hypothetical protein